MADVSNIIQMPVSTTSPQIKITQPFVVKSPFYYQGAWGFNLANGSNNYVVYQDHVGNDVTGASGASFAVGRANTLSGVDIITIGDQNVSSYDNCKMFGNHLTASHEAHFYYGEYNSIEQSYSYVTIGAGYDNSHRFNALEAGYNNGFFVKIGDVNSSVQVPVTVSGVTTMQDIRTYFASRDDVISLAGDITTINDKIPVTASSSNKLVDKAQADATYVERDKQETYARAAYIQFYNNGSYYDGVIELSIYATQDTIPLRNTRGEVIVPDTTYSGAAVNYGQMTSYVGTQISSAISNVYKFQGTATVSELNSMTKSADMNGFVYNIGIGGTLNNNTLPASTVAVSAGDNVAFVWDDNYGMWHWDKLAATVDLSGYVQKTTTIAGNALSSDISAQTLTDSLVQCNATTDVDYIMGD